MDKTSIKTILDDHDAQPKKRFGQNFLVDRNAIENMAKAAGLGPKDVVLEIGPGLGSLTKEIAKIAKKVIAVEFDRRMVKVLEDTLHLENVEIIEADILKFDETGLPSPYKVVANLPFYLSAPAIRKFLESKNPPSDLTLIVQKEVAQRIAAKPGEMSILAVATQFYAIPKIIRVISRNCFWPVPNVDSAILRLTPKINRPEKQFSDLFFMIVKAGFSQPRKQLINNFLQKLPRADGQGREGLKLWLKESGIDPARRAETLSIEEWINLAKAYSIKS
ncbi:MAG: 16S rRNA (adenine(1518)-N(6)/adenine(1519)-N(6))-dimethyltransferase RsmA [Candidatus Nealsonbacteria bacterium]|nr:16S rRNA (adenine(1518)-N(6)/adenine(1519)-N(6))-dimethyltransferase RsmA [Candidatus Nealsonbacteria bacterium]